MSSFDNLLIEAMDYIDGVWILILALVMRRGQKLWAAGFVAICMMMMRLMIDLMESIGYPYGLLGLLDISLFDRGLWTYSFIYCLYGAAIYFFSGTKGIFLIAFSLSSFFIASALYAVVMVL